MSTAQLLPHRLTDFFHDVTLIDAVTVEEAALLYRIVRELKPRCSAETGLNRGGSTAAILQALEDNDQGTHYVFDPYQTAYAHGAGPRNVAAAGLASRFVFQEDFPERHIPSLPALQFAFLDGGHHFNDVLLDFVLVDRRLDVGGVIGFHDVGLPGIRKCLRFILNNYGHYVTYMPAGEPPPRPPSWRHRIVASAARLVPGANRLFAQELLDRRGYGIGPTQSMMFLRKTGPDTRHWTYYRPF